MRFFYLSLILFTSNLVYAGICDTNTTGAVPAQRRPSINLNLWRYFGQPDFTSGAHAGTRLEGGTFNHLYMGHFKSTSYTAAGPNTLSNYSIPSMRMINPATAELDTDGKGTTTFERLQRFSLNLMKKRDYLDANGVEKQIERSFELVPSQVTILEATESKAESELLAAGGIPNGARDDSASNAHYRYRPFKYEGGSITAYLFRIEPIREFDKFYEVKVGVSWLIAGQVLNQNYKLGLEDENLEKPIDRKKYVHVWELGRAGQTRTAAFIETIRMAIFVAYSELLASGGNLDDAYLFAHALDEKRTHLFELLGMTVYSGYKGSPNERAMVVSLRDALQKFPLDLVSEKVKAVVSLSKNKLTPNEAFEWITEYKKSLNSFAHTKSHRSGFAIRDFSSVPRNALSQKIKSLNLSTIEEAELFGYLQTIEPGISLFDAVGDKHDENMGYENRKNQESVLRAFKDVPFVAQTIPVSRPRGFFHRHNVVEVQPLETSESPGSLVEALKVAVAVTRKQYLPTANSLFCVSVTDSLHGYHQQFGELKQLNPAQHWVNALAEHSIPVRMGSGFFSWSYNVNLQRGHRAESMCFTADQIDQWGEAVLIKDDFNAQRFLMDPQLYGPN